MSSETDPEGYFDEFNRITQDGWNAMWKIPEGSSFAELESKPDRCVVIGCIGPRIGGPRSDRHSVEMGPLDILVSDYCTRHALFMGRYGAPERPPYLDHRANCEHVQVIQDTGHKLFCQEPRVANRLCTSHVWKPSALANYQDVLATVKIAELHSEPMLGPVTDDTRRVLAELDRIARVGSSSPHMPITSTQAFFSFGAAMFARHQPLGLHDRAGMAFESSPFLVGRVLNIPAQQVAANIETLIASGFIAIRVGYEVPPGFVFVVREESYSKAARRYVQKQRISNLFPSRYVKVMYSKPPKAGTKIYSVVFDGPGAVHPCFQAQTYELTTVGAVELQAWHDRLGREAREQRQDNSSRRVGMAALVITVASLISVIADAPVAISNLGALLRLIWKILATFLGQ